jgi:plasmid stabilization system protein ParE
MRIQLSTLAAYKTQVLLDFLEEKWSVKTKEKFIQKFIDRLKAVENNPEGFPQSEVRPELRKVVITKQTTLLYKITADAIFVITLIDNRQNPDSIEKEIEKHFGSRRI